MDRLRLLSDQLQAPMRDFRELVWSAGMSELIAQTQQRGMRGEFGSVVLLVFELAGRVMLTFQTGDSQLTLVVRASDRLGDSMGLHSATCGLQLGMQMIARVIAGWPEEAEARQSVLRPDPYVTIQTPAGPFPH